MLEPMQYLLGAASGALVGLVLGTVGGGGSILAVPLLVYLVGVDQPHIAIGTSAFAVAANAAWGLIGHARAKAVNWRCGFIYAGAGIFGAMIGSTVGKLMDGQKLLFLFALVMVLIGVLMLRRRQNLGIPGALCTRENVHKVIAFGFATGLFSGFFGIGGGFLIVPGLIAATGMPIIGAVGTSLVAVTAFGMTAAANYALDGYVDFKLATIFILGGLVGSAAGVRLARHLSAKGRLTTVFAYLVLVVAAFMIWKSGQALHLI